MLEKLLRVLLSGVVMMLETMLRGLLVVLMLETLLGGIVIMLLSLESSEKCCVCPRNHCSYTELTYQIPLLSPFHKKKRKSQNDQAIEASLGAGLW